MNFIVKHIEKKLGRKVDLERDEEGRWKIPQHLVDSTNIKFDQIVHSFEFDSVGDVMRVRESAIPWEVYSDREVFDLGKEEMRKGKALMLFPKGYAPKRNETLFLEDSKLHLLTKMADTRF